jgi:hypothetical protein
LEFRAEFFMLRIISYWQTLATYFVKILTTFPAQGNFARPSGALGLLTSEQSCPGESAMARPARWIPGYKNASQKYRAHRQPLPPKAISAQVLWKSRPASIHLLFLP